MVARKRAGTATRATRKGRGSKAGPAPWERANPKKRGAHEHLGPKAKAAAKSRAKKAGRRYPNLVDNMRAAAEEKN